MELKLAETIVKLCKDLGNHDIVDVEIRPDYPYTCGKTTTAIVGLRLSKLVAMVIENADIFVDEDNCPIFESVGHLHQDQLGRKYVIY